MFHRRLPKTALAAAAALTATMGIGLTARASQAATRLAPAAAYTLHTLPSSGEAGWFYSLVNGARSSINLTMYELQDTTAEHDLGNAAARGVNVRVILDQREQSGNQTAFNYLKGHGVKVVWSWSKYYYTHQKTMVVDNSTAAVMTLNLQSQYYSTTRDFAVIDTNASDVSAIVNVFNHDFAHTSVTPGDGADLVWSPTDSQKQLTALINGAKTNLEVYANEMDDPAVTSDLASAAKRGVKVQVVGENEDGEYNSEYSQLHSAGVQISYYSNPDGFYIHAKGIIADYGTSRAKIFLGSENFSNTSLTENRELGLIISNPAIESSVDKTFEGDFSGGTKWT